MRVRDEGNTDMDGGGGGRRHGDSSPLVDRELKIRIVERLGRVESSLGASSAAASGAAHSAGTLGSSSSSSDGAGTAPAGAAQQPLLSRDTASGMTAGSAALRQALASSGYGTTLQDTGHTRLLDDAALDHLSNERLQELTEGLLEDVIMQLVQHAQAEEELKQEVGLPALLL